MSQVRRLLPLSGIVVMLSVLLSACGGGGGTPSSQTGTLVNPALSYAGASNQATVSADNAFYLALGGFGGDAIGSSLQPSSNALAKTSAAAQNQERVGKAALVVKQALRRMSLPAKALQRRGSKTADKALLRAVTHQIQGDTGGYLTYSFDINDATGSFFGTIDFREYSSQGIIISGKADMLGTFDAAYQDFSRVTLSFQSLSTVAGRNGSYTLVGTLSWVFNLGAGTETQSMNMVLLAGGKLRGQ
jgi:hypothetical protein